MIYNNAIRSIRTKERYNINVCIKLPHLPLQVNITVFSADHNSQIFALVTSWDF